MPDTSDATPSFTFRTPEVVLSEHDWPCDDDLLTRNKEIENISPIMLSAQGPLVLAVDAPWGGGKTTFIHLWQHYLKKQQQISVSLNAWESDFSGDPLIPMLAALEEWVKADSDNSELQKRWKTAKKNAPRVGKRLLSAGIKAATFGAVEMEAPIEKVFADLTGEATEALLAQYKAMLQWAEQQNRPYPKLWACYQWRSF